MGRPAIPLEERFWSRVEITGFCWNWVGTLSPAGYGRITEADRTEHLAHRWAYETLTQQAIPKGMHIDHLCRNRACVNPDHMEVVPGAVNVMRGFGPPAKNARKTHCQYGHELPQQGEFYDRTCRECRRKTWREYAQKKRDAAARWT